MTTNEYMRCVKEGKLLPFDKKLWQKSYYDHISPYRIQFITTIKGTDNRVFDYLRCFTHDEI